MKRSSKGKNVNFMEMEESESDKGRRNKMRRMESGSDDSSLGNYKVAGNGRMSNIKRSNNKRSDSQQQSQSASQQSNPNPSPKKPSSIKQTSPQLTSTTLTRCLFSYIRRLKPLPTLLTPYLQKRLSKYDPSDPLVYYPFHPKDLNFSVRTTHGLSGIKQLIRYLQDVESKQSDNIVKEVNVQWSHQLHRAASRRVEAIQKGDQRVMELDVGELVSQFAIWKAPLFQIVVYGFIDPKEILAEAFLEDGSGGKKNRAEFFSQGAKYVGIDFGFHEQYQVVTVMMFSGGIGQLQELKNEYYTGERERQCQCQMW